MVETTLKTVSYIIILVQNGPNGAQNDLLHHHISQKRPKGSETVQNYRKGVKIFKNLKFFFVNSKKFKNYISFEIFTQLSLELQTQIPRVLDEIRHPFFQVTSHALLFHLHVNFSNFHGENLFLDNSKLCTTTHC